MFYHYFKGSSQNGGTASFTNQVDKVCKTIETVTKAWGSEISWTVGECANNQQYASRRTYNQTCCLAEGEWPVTCSDSYGDGWHGGYLVIDGNKFCDDFTSGIF